MQKKGYRYFAYLNLGTGERYISVGTKVLINKLGISKATLYNRVKDDGWYVDENYAVFWVEKKDVLHDVPKNNNLKLSKGVNSEPSGVVLLGEPAEKKDKTVSKPKKNQTKRTGVKKDQKNMGEETGNNDGVQNSTHETVPESPSSPVVVEPVVVPIDTSGDKWAKAVQEQKEKLSKKEVVDPAIDAHTSSVAAEAVRKQKEKDFNKELAENKINMDLVL